MSSSPRRAALGDTEEVGKQKGVRDPADTSATTILLSSGKERKSSDTVAIFQLYLSWKKMYEALNSRVKKTPTKLLKSRVSV